MTISEKVRNNMYLVLKGVDEKMSFMDVFNELKKIYPEELVVDGENRTGVLSGVVNKRYKLPIKNVKKIGKGRESFFIYFPYGEGGCNGK